MARCKMDRPERADYFRVFARHMLTDEDYDCLSGEEMGSVFFLMLQQWCKGGSLPADPLKLASLARCSPDELNQLLKKWPKLQPIEGAPDRVGIPYLVREWDRVMAFYEEQAQKSALGVAARKPMGTPVINPRVAHGSPAGLPNQDQDQDQDQDQKKESVPPPVEGKPKRVRRSKEEKISGFSDQVREVVNTLGPQWRTEDPVDGRKITQDVGTFAQRISEILAAHPEVTHTHLIEAGAAYIASTRNRYKAPQFFFGPGMGSEGPPWLGYVRSIMTRKETPRELAS